MRQLVMNLVLYAVAWLLLKTYRIRFFNFDRRQRAHALHHAHSTAIALWHCNSFIGTLSHSFQPYAPLCSLSPDGQMVAFLCRRIGMEPVLGSSTRGGKEARNQLEDAVARGLSPAITVDGPKGPKGIAKNGIIDIGRKTGVAILPMIALGDRYWQLGSWDRLRIPKPFARIAVCYGEPIQVRGDVSGETFEELRQTVDRVLHALEHEARATLDAWEGTKAFKSYREVVRGAAMLHEPKPNGCIA